MNKEEFLQRLKKNLKDVKNDDLEDILEDYEEHFEEAIKDGKSEEEICKDLGDPKDIAKELKAYSVVEKAEGNFSIGNILRVIATFLSLGIFNLVLIFPYLGAVATLFGIGIVSIGIVLGGVGGIAILLVTLITGLTTIAQNTLMTLLYSLGAIGGGLILGALDFFAIKYFYRFTIKYIKMNIKLVKDRD
jgi:uncharacterized membrane protein